MKLSDEELLELMYAREEIVKKTFRIKLPKKWARNYVEWKLPQIQYCDQFYGREIEYGLIIYEDMLDLVKFFIAGEIEGKKFTLFYFWAGRKALIINIEDVLHRHSIFSDKDIVCLEEKRND